MPVKMTKLAKTLLKLFNISSHVALNRPGNTHVLAGRSEQVLSSLWNWGCLTVFSNKSQCRYSKMCLLISIFHIIPIKAKWPASIVRGLMTRKCSKQSHFSGVFSVRVWGDSSLEKRLRVLVQHCAWKQCFLLYEVLRSQRARWGIGLPSVWELITWVLWEITDRGAKAITFLSEFWKQYEEEQIDMFIVLWGYESFPLDHWRSYESWYAVH